jgi:hypothetical protein
MNSACVLFASGVGRKGCWLTAPLGQYRHWVRVVSGGMPLMRRTAKLHPSLDQFLSQRGRSSQQILLVEPFLYDLHVLWASGQCQLVALCS